MTDPQLPLDLDVVIAGQLDSGPITSWTWQVWVPGTPAPQGSKKAMPIYRGSRAKGTREFTGKTVMLEQRRKGLDPWRAAVTEAAKDAWSRGAPCTVPVLLGAMFLLPPWKSTRAGDWPTGSRTGDLDKLIRAVGDSLTEAEVWTDDRLVVGYLGWPQTGKRFARPGEDPGCTITLRPAPVTVVAP